MPPCRSRTKFTAGDFTVSLWFNPATDNKSNWLFMRGFGWHDQHGDIGLMINPHSGDLDFVANSGGNSQWILGWDVPESRLRSAFTLNAWNHVVVTRRGDTYTMWMNGDRVGREQSPDDISDTDNTNPFVVAGFTYNDGVRRNISGRLDEFRIFRRCLSGEEIAALYEAGAQRIPGSAAVPKEQPASGDAHTRQFDDADRISAPMETPAGEVSEPKPADEALRKAQDELENDGRGGRGGK